MADPRALDPVVIHRLGVRLHRCQHAVRDRLEHPKHDRLPGAARRARRVNDPDRVHVVLLFLPGAAPGLLGGGGRSIAAIAPTLGPVIGGWITDTLNWHWLFYVNLIPGIAITVLVPMLVRIDQPNLSLLRGADYPGIVLMAVGLGTLEYVLEEGTRWNWFSDQTIRTCAWIDR